MVAERIRNEYFKGSEGWEALEQARKTILEIELNEKEN
jgi:hypothetical protein